MAHPIYNWQFPGWPDFTYDLTESEPLILTFADLAGQVSGIFKVLPEGIKADTLIDIMMVEALKSSEIEGVYLSRRDVVSSLRRRMGLWSDAPTTGDKKADGYAAIMVEIRNTYTSELTAEQLFYWHKLLLPGSRNIRTGAWRMHDEPMQVVSGAVGKETIHFEAPPSVRVPFEMERFLKWFNNTAPQGKTPLGKNPLRAAIAHLYFETIHPFEDGNGRIGRLIAEKAMAQDLGRPILMSLSQAIEANKKSYYTELEKAQRSMDISSWIHYFFQTAIDAQSHFKNQLEFVILVTAFFDKWKSMLNERQEKVLRRMFEEGPAGFSGGMNARKYRSITHTSKATATRDLQELVHLGIMKPSLAAGRSRTYDIVMGGSKNT